MKKLFLLTVFVPGLTGEFDMTLVRASEWLTEISVEVAKAGPQLNEEEVRTESLPPIPFDRLKILLTDLPHGKQAFNSGQPLNTSISSNGE